MDLIMSDSYKEQKLLKHSCILILTNTAIVNKLCSLDVLLNQRSAPVQSQGFAKIWILIFCGTFFSTFANYAFHPSRIDVLSRGSRRLICFYNTTETGDKGWLHGLLSLWNKLVKISSQINTF